MNDGTGRVDLSFTVEEAQRTVRVPPGVTVFDAASWNGIAIDSTCGGHGTCHKCKVRVEGSTPITRHDLKTFTRDQLDEGWRLACLVNATRDLAVDVPPLTTRPKAATVGVGRQVILRPAIQKRYVELDEPTLADQRTDLDRLLAAIDDLEPVADLHVLRRLPTVLRAADFKVTAVIVDEALVDVEPGDTTTAQYAIAFDLGTTTVVATLLDVATGTPVAVASMLNRQQPFGGDVITRISATMMDPDALGRLQVAASESLSTLAIQVCTEGGVDPAHVYEVAIAGNATMTALLLGIDPEPLGVAPFIMSSPQPPDVLASEIGLSLHPRARATLFPALGAYVGGDIVAGMLASGMDRDKRTRLFIDVGTNCEIVLSDGDRILSTAAPAGPAFEGGAIRCGMRAADGAIEVVKMGDSDNPVELGVIGDVEPKGLCGSGLVDAVAELVKVGLLDASGRYVPEEVAKEVAPALADRLTMIGQERVFVLHRPSPGAEPEDCVVLSQRDVRELQFAKAAISTGWSLLLEELGLEHRDVQQVLLAGSFGSYLSAASAVRIGLVPKLPVLRIVAAGNVAGEGAKMALLSVRERAGARALLEEVTYVELSDRPEFNDRFVDQLGF
ncbi:metal-binding protein [Nocardioides sp. Root1257]|uniref:ASKHA domain-containing protein n=1 Tax=unclassified Nocardioides TaxID=2615069 RepID=UPI0006FD90AD|nr:MULTISPECIES: ASKHA domain-containing protein [unclassified Nocardioides]KQW47525.1 metal-binding protein [Nocardioides sp. Root1257]KRC45681.1 metal-binding protein [Nocardioides sp. Root224]